ncbi:MAG TPA: hypothetical protein VKZ44_08310, partial [Taishania sp.]|nr:hypothetical protein [Taishania sp.]
GNLLLSIHLKWLAKELGFERIVLKNGVMLAYFINQPNSSYYQSEQFQHIISTLHENPRLATFKERKSRSKDENNTLMLRFENIKSVKIALEKLNVLNIQVTSI